MKHETKIPIPSAFWLIAFIFITMPISGVGLDVYVPSLPNIQHDFGVGKNIVQLTVSLFVLGNACTQLLFGTLSDRYGRRHIILFGSFVLALSAFLATTATSIWFLLVMRFCEGIGVAACIGACRAMPADVFKGDSYNKVVGGMVTAWGLGRYLPPSLVAIYNTILVGMHRFIF